MTIGACVSDLQVGDTFVPVDFVVTPFANAAFSAGYGDSEGARAIRQACTPEAAVPTLVHIAKYRLIRANCPGGAGPLIQMHYEYAARSHAMIAVGSRLRIGGQVSARARSRSGLDVLTLDLKLIDPVTDACLIDYRNRTVLGFSRTAGERTGNRISSITPRSNEPDASVTITRADMRSYSDSVTTAAADEDVFMANRPTIHTDDGRAVSAGLPGVAADGLMTTNWINSILTERYGVAYLEAGSLRTLYRRPVLADDRLHLWLTARAPDGGRSAIALDVVVTDDDGQVRTTGDAVTVRDRVPATPGNGQGS